MNKENLELPVDSWLSPEAFKYILSLHDKQWARVESTNLRNIVAADFIITQNEAMLSKFFLEQAFGFEKPGQRCLRIVERDFGSFHVLEQEFFTLARTAKVNYIVLGLSFADFSFHLFPVTSEPNGVPFCISPMMCACLLSEVIALSRLTREEFIQQQWTHIHWGVVENRLACLEEPLDLFNDPKDCMCQ